MPIEVPLPHPEPAEIPANPELAANELDDATSVEHQDFASAFDAPSESVVDPINAEVPAAVEAVSELPAEWIEILGEHPHVESALEAAALVLRTELQGYRESLIDLETHIRVVQMNLNEVSQLGVIDSGAQEEDFVGMARSRVLVPNYGNCKNSGAFGYWASREICATPSGQRTTKICTTTLCKRSTRINSARTAAGATRTAARQIVGPRSGACVCSAN